MYVARRLRFDEDDGLGTLASELRHQLYGLHGAFALEDPDIKGLPQLVAVLGDGDGVDARSPIRTGECESVPFSSAEETVIVST